MSGNPFYPTAVLHGSAHTDCSTACTPSEDIQWKRQRYPACYPRWHRKLSDNSAATSACNLHQSSMPASCMLSSLTTANMPRHATTPVANMARHAITSHATTPVADMLTCSLLGGRNPPSFPPTRLNQTETALGTWLGTHFTWENHHCTAQDCSVYNCAIKSV